MWLYPQNLARLFSCISRTRPASSPVTPLRSLRNHKTRLALVDAASRALPSAAVAPLPLWRSRRPIISSAPPSRFALCFPSRFAPTYFPLPAHSRFFLSYAQHGNHMSPCIHILAASSAVDSCTWQKALKEDDNHGAIARQARDARAREERGRRPTTSTIQLTFRSPTSSSLSLQIQS